MTDSPLWLLYGEVTNAYHSIGAVFYNTDADTFIPQLMDRLSSLVEQVISAGGRKFLFLNVPPTGRTPFFLAQGEETVAQHAAYLDVYNQQLESLVTGLSADGTEVSTVLPHTSKSTS